MRATFASLVATLLNACGLIRSGDPAPFNPVKADSIARETLCAAACTDSLDIVSLGVGGYLFIPWRDTTRLVMTPPFYTHPSAWRMATLDFVGGTRSNRERVQERLKALAPVVDTARLSRVQAVLVGHAHYDHLMDLPTMAPWLPNARIFGSRTAVNLLHAVETLRPRLVNVEPEAAYDVTVPGNWQPVGPSMRFRATAWEHAANARNKLFRYTIATGDVLTPQTRIRWRARGWKKGRVYAYELDVLGDDGRPKLRLIVNDAAAGPRVSRRAGQVWQLDPAPSTVLLTTAASFDKVYEYPDLLLAMLKPQHLVLGHWEDFFRSPDKTPRIVRGTNGPALKARLEAIGAPKWSALEPGAVLRVHY